MLKLIAAVAMTTFLLSACGSAQALPSSTPLPEAPATSTPLPPTSTPPPTATATPVPMPLSADNFEKLEVVSSSTLDQTEFVGFETEKKDFYTDEANIPEGEVKAAHFESYRWLENGDLTGMLVYFPLECGERQLGNEIKRSCSYNRYYHSMINLSKRTTIWKQFLPVNMAGSELKQLVDELGLKNFAPRPLFTNRGYVTNEWSNDNRLIAVPIQVVDSTVVKDVQSGKNIFIYPWGSSASWIGSISPDGKKFATISGGPTGGPDSLLILDLASGKVENRFTVSGMATDLAWSKDGSKIAIGTRNGFLGVFEPGTNTSAVLRERRFDLENEWQGGIFRISFSGDGSNLAFTEHFQTKTGEKISRLTMFNLATKKEVNTFPADFYQTGEIIWDRGGSFVVTVTDFTDGRIVILDADKTVEVPLTSPGDVADYKPKIFTSLVSFNADQTRLTLVRSLFNDATVDEYEVRQ